MPKPGALPPGGDDFPFAETWHHSSDGISDRHKFTLYFQQLNGSHHSKKIQHSEFFVQNIECGGESAVGGGSDLYI
jgi:hypothetical protein